MLKRDGLALEQTQVETARSLFNLAALAVVAAARIIQLTDARDAGVRPASDVIDEGLIAATAAIGETLEGKTARQKNPHPRGSLSWLAWITARLGGWHGYYRPPGPKPWLTVGAVWPLCSTAMRSPMANHLCESRRVFARGPVLGTKALHRRRGVQERPVDRKMLRAQQSLHLRQGE